MRYKSTFSSAKTYFVKSINEIAGCQKFANLQRMGLKSTDANEKYMEIKPRYVYIRGYENNIWMGKTIG